MKTAASQVWWLTPVISALRKLRQDDSKFQSILGYIARSVTLFLGEG
jgi:hypothetical protein